MTAHDDVYAELPAPESTDGPQFPVDELDLVEAECPTIPDGYVDVD